MDKFVIRKPTWKSMNYDTIAAAAVKKVNENGNSSGAAAFNKNNKIKETKKAPLQESGQINNLSNAERVKQIVLKERENIRKSLANTTLDFGIGALTESFTSTRIVANNFEDENNKSKGVAETESNKTNHKDLEPSAKCAAIDDELNKVNFERNNYKQTENNNLQLRTEPVISRIQNDFNSPSAALRLRAIRAMRTPSNTEYDNFDVPHAEQSIISASERNPPELPKLNEILKNVIVYVEVRTGGDNRSEGVKKVIASMGARVNDNLLRNTTHVVFKDGLLSTFKKATNWKIPVVSILWIEGCKNRLKLCDPKEFPITNLDQYENPELYPKMVRHRTVQPDSESTRRIRKPATPTTITGSSKELCMTPKNIVKNTIGATELITPTSSTFKKTEITHFFKTLGSSSKKPNTPSTESVVESPATRFLNKISSGSLTPIQTTNKTSNTTASKLQKAAEVNESVLINSDMSNQKDSIITPKPKPRVTRRSTVDASTNTPTSVPITRRRSSLQAVNSITDNVPQTPKSLRKVKPNIQSIVEEDGIDAPQQRLNNNETNYAHESLDISMLPQNAAIAKPQTTHRRRTLFAPLDMDITAKDMTQQLVKSSETNLNSKSIISSESRQSSLVEEESPGPVFSSTRLPNNNRRLTLHDVSMDIINQRLSSINESSRRRSMAPVTPISNLTANDCQTPLLADKLPKPTTNIETPTEVTNKNTPAPNTSAVRRRKLFIPNSEFMPQSPSPVKSIQKRKRRTMAAVASPSVINENEIPAATAIDANQNNESIGKTTKTQKKTIVKRDARRSTLDFEQVKHMQQKNKTKVDKEAALPLYRPAPMPDAQQNELNSANNTSKVPEVKNLSQETNAVSTKAKKRKLPSLVYTNMHQEHVHVIRKAVEQLRHFKLDLNVNANTTHLISLEPRRTMNMLRGLMRGVWIVQYRWVLDSLRAGAWVDAENYEMKTFSRAVEICRAERQAFGKNYRCELFRHMEFFYVSSHSKTVAPSSVLELLTLGNANITEHRWRAKYIIGDKRREEDDRIYLSGQWVLDSVEAMQIQRFSKYLMKSAIIVPNEPTFQIQQPVVGCIVKQTNFQL